MSTIDLADMTKSNIEFIEEVLKLVPPNEVDFDKDVALKCIEMYRKCLLLALLEAKVTQASPQLRQRVRDAIKDRLVDSSIKYPEGWHGGWLVPDDDAGADGLLDDITDNIMDRVYTRDR